MKIRVAALLGASISIAGSILKSEATSSPKRRGPTDRIPAFRREEDDDFHTISMSSFEESSSSDSSPSSSLYLPEELGIDNKWQDQEDDWGSRSENAAAEEQDADEIDRIILALERIQDEDDEAPCTASPRRRRNKTKRAHRSEKNNHTMRRKKKVGRKIRRKTQSNVIKLPTVEAEGVNIERTTSTKPRVPSGIRSASHSSISSGVDSKVSSRGDFDVLSQYAPISSGTTPVKRTSSLPPSYQRSKGNISSQQKPSLNSNTDTLYPPSQPDRLHAGKPAQSPNDVIAFSSTKATKTTTRMPALSSRTTATTSGASTTPWIRKFLAGRPRDLLLPIPKDYIADTFNLAQLPPIVERIGFHAMGDDAVPVAKALQQHRLALAAAAEAAATSSADGSTVLQPSRIATSSAYPIYRRALQLILQEDENYNIETEVESGEDLIIPYYAIQKAAEALYLMVHARFVISPRGLEAIRHVMMMDPTVFGKCPRTSCRGCGLLPYGFSNDYTFATPVSKTKADPPPPENLCHRYCPSCGEVWISWDSKTDGCAWGPSWCHLFLLAFGTQVYAEELARITASRNDPSTMYNPPLRSRIFENVSAPLSRASTVRSSPPPSVFGFRIHPATPFGRPFTEQSLAVSGGAAQPSGGSMSP
jgi:hypothetical protein